MFSLAYSHQIEVVNLEDSVDLDSDEDNDDEDSDSDTSMPGLPDAPYGGYGRCYNCGKIMLSSTLEHQTICGLTPISGLKVNLVFIGSNNLSSSL